MKFMSFFRKRRDKKRNKSELPGHEIFGERYRQFGGSAPAQHQYENGGLGATANGGYVQIRRPHSPTRASAAKLAELPSPVLERIFAFVCPHTQDRTYETQEQSSLEDACMLCDLRDLAHCVQVCRRWKRTAVKVLYHSIRIETVHYCDREAILADKRKRRTFHRSGEPEDTSQMRLKLLCRTLRDDPARLGPLVEYFKTPYMLRESCQADLARTIAVLPNLRYVDMPEGLFTDDASYITLRLEVEARCLNLRKMTYMHGAERSLERLANGQVFRSLEVLELNNVHIDPTILVHVLGTLGNLRALKVTDSTILTDEVIAHTNEMMPAFPALEELILTRVPGITARGLRAYLSRYDAQRALKVLTVTETGVKPWTLQEILATAPELMRLSISEVVSTSLPSAAGTPQIPPLASKSLQVLHYEITEQSSSTSYSNFLTSYYNYLSGSLLMGGLPNLQALYVRDAKFADSLAGLPPPAPKFAAEGFKRPSSSSSHGSSAFSSNSLGQPLSPSYLNQSFNGHAGPQASPQNGHNPFQSQSQNGNNPFPSQTQNGKNPFQDMVSKPSSLKPFPVAGYNPRFSSNNPFASLAGPNGPSGLPQTLEVFTKGDDELNWGVVKVEPGSALPAAESVRPGSSYGLDDSNAGWNSRAGARKSVFLGNGAGGFLAVPDLPAVAGVRRGSAPTGSDEWPRPKSSAGDKRNSRIDLWR